MTQSPPSNAKKPLLIGWNGFFTVRGWWQNISRMRNRILLLVALVLPPILIGSSVFTVQANQQDLEDLLLERAKANAVTGATMLGKSFEVAIETGVLTRDQVFDRNYAKFADFNPADDPANDPKTAEGRKKLTKYHTAYDAFTDKNWPALIESFISPEGNIIYAVAVDINGYVPTHNKRYSSGNGSIATDRAKRIFDDPVGIKSATNTEPILQQVYVRPGTGETLWDLSAPIYVNGEHWGGFRVGVQLAQNQQRIINATLRASVTALLTLLAVLAFAWFLGRYISRPIENLTAVASQVAAGNLDLRVTTTGQDEIAILGQAFNQMILLLRDLISSLEQRIADRTRGLVLAADVGRSVSQVRELDVMLKDAAELIRAQFNLYYVQVYLTDTSQTNLILQSGTGTVGAELVGRGHRLPLNTASINGRAAIEKRSVVVSNTTASPTFRPNPLLPETRSEMAAPLLVGDKVVGVLDLQSSEAEALNQDILPAIEALAGQLAIAIQNANLLAETEQARAEVEKQAARLARTGWQDYLDAIHKPEHTGFVFEQNQITPLDESEPSQWPAEMPALTAPIAISGEPLGSLVVGLDPEKQSPQAAELVNIVARQVAQQIENLRLLESANRYRAEAEQASRRLTREGWEGYLESQAVKSLGYSYNLKEILPVSSDQSLGQEGVTIPLKIHDEPVGKLFIQGINPDDQQALDLANAVSERLSAHIEGLRLTRQTEQTARREQALRQITSAVRGSTDPASILRAAVRELGTILGRKTLIRVDTAGEPNQLPETGEPVSKEPESPAAPETQSPEA